MYTGPQASYFKVGHRLSAKMARALLNVAHRQHASVSAAQEFQVLPFGTVINPPQGPEYGHGTLMFQRSFVGRITLPPAPNVFDPDAVGPPPPDFPDERYWVKEVHLSDPVEYVDFQVPGYKQVTYARPRHNHDDPIQFNAQPDPPYQQIDFPDRYVVASNLGELDIHTHGLGVPYGDTDQSGRYVLCHTLAGWNDSQYHVFDAAVAQATEWVVVNAIVLEPVYALQVTPVAFKAQDTGQGLPSRVEYSGSPVVVWPWPNTPVSYYARYVWQGDLDQTTPVLRAQQIAGQWHVEQNLRHRLPPYPTSQRFADCAPPEFTTPDNRVGACCQVNGDCQVMSLTACEQAGGFYQGDDTTCNVIDCCQLPQVNCE